jgi:class 3 adenylate cyclase
MATTTATRRLAAILAADVVGYSRLMGADEEGTHERFKAHLVELIDPKIREHHGRIVKTTGDGVLAEFASVVDACAVRAKFNARWPTAIWISPRSGASDFASASISAT